MKTTIMILMVAGGLAMQAAAASPDNRPSASTNILGQHETSVLRILEAQDGAQL